MKFSMKTTAFAALSAAALTLSACGSSDTATEEASPDNAEMPAEEAVSTVPAMPVPDDGAAAAGSAAAAAAAAATETADPNAGAPASDAAANAAAAAADFDAAGEGAEKAIDQAEKKM